MFTLYQIKNPQTVNCLPSSHIKNSLRKLGLLNNGKIFTLGLYPIAQILASQ